MAEVVQFPSQLVPPVMTMVMLDAEARVRALDTRTSCVVEAPAGSGKTGLLVQRYLKLLGDESVDEPEEVLAITFTNKATAELRERVLEQLQAAALGVTLAEGEEEFEVETRALASAAVERGRRRGWGLVERPQRLNIRSIDSVCAEIANSLPLLSGGEGPRQPVENAGPLYRMAARRTVMQLGGKDAALHEALRTVLLHRDGSVADVEGLVAGMLETREQWGELVPLGPGELSEEMLDREVRLKLERSLEGVVCAGLTRAVKAMPAGVLEELTRMAAMMGMAPAFKAEVSPLAICAGRNEPPAEAAEHLEHWLALISLVLTQSGGWRKRCGRADLKFEIQKDHQGQLEMFVASIQNDALQDALCGVRALPPAKYPDDQWVVAKALFRVLRRALAELRVVFAERGECDFTELALAARTALRAEEGASDVALSAGGRLRHLLVDEMQDTSSGQYELLELLTQTWDGHTQTLFLVGDPKQSVYLFRQARVERFLRTMREGRLGEIRLQALQLTANFRSQARLVGDFNGMFARVFPAAGEADEGEALDVPFVAATAARASVGDVGIEWHEEVLGDEVRDDRAAEARRVRRVIQKRLEMPLPAEREGKPWRIAVLGRARTHLAAVVEELKRVGVRYRGVDLDPLDELPEVLDALALTRALLHPADRVAWLAVLHAPWCGLGLADLLRLTGEGSEADAGATVAGLVASRRGMLSEDGQRLLERAWPVLDAAVEGVGRTSLVVHVERTWRSLGGDVGLSAEGRGNVGRFLGVLREVEDGGETVDVGVLTGRLKTLYAEPLSDAVVDGVKPVELMTIHKAKGLEWDVVLVPGLERGGGRSGGVLLNWLEFDGAGGSAASDAASIVLAPIWSKGTEKDKLSGWLSGVRARREGAERKRVMYVAATRAREELHLFGAVERKVSGEVKEPRHDSLLKAVWPAVAERFRRAADGGGAEVVEMLRRSLVESLVDEEEEDGLALAASGGDEAGRKPMIQRLPMGFDPGARFREAALRRLAYPVAAGLRRAPVFARPEGSFAVRAFGNVVHRYLQVMAGRMAAGVGAEALAAELSGWGARLTASLRGEGLAPVVAAREAARALRALMLTMGDEVGRWILSPQVGAASESALVMEDARVLRVDRTFVAGATPGAGGEECVWIVDFKTTEQGSRGDAEFEAGEKAKYRAQLEAYAAARRGMPGGERPIRLGLYYPLVPRLVWWEGDGEETGRTPGANAPLFHGQ